MSDRPAEACIGGAFKFEEMFTGADVVLRATVKSIEDATTPSSQVLIPSDKAATLEVSEVWKGHSNGTATLRYTEQNTACGVTLEPGEIITLFAGQDREGQLYAGWPQIAEHSNFSLSLPFLADYRRQTDALRAAFLNGGEPEAIAFAHHLTRWNAGVEAVTVYQGMIDRYDHDARAYLGLALAQYSLRDHDDADRSLNSAMEIDPSLRLIERTDPKLLGGRIARARFVLIGQVDTRDLAGLKPEGACVLDGRRLDGVNFASADLSNCNFDNARLKKVDFHGAKLNSASFHTAWLEDVDFSGADLTKASFARALVNVGDLVGTRDRMPAIGFLEAGYDGASLACTLEDANYFNTSFNSGMRRLWLPKLRIEQEALRSIVEQWPTARLTKSCQSLIEVDLTKQ